MAATKKSKEAKKKQWRALITEWIELLRSGKFKQGKGSLHEVNIDGVAEFCCLGVFDKMLADKKLIKKPVDHNSSFSYEGCVSALSGKALTLSGLNLALGEYVGDDTTSLCSLADLNDGTSSRKRKTFKQIARFIEQQLKTNSKKLFKEELFQ